MTTFKVTATGNRTGAQYVYEVEHERTASEFEVFLAACNEHGRLLADGVVTDYLSIRSDEYTVERLTH